MKSFQLNRRALLRGTGVAMALPLMEAMLPQGKTAFAAAAQPPRFMAFYTSCGIMDQYYGMPVGPINTLSQTLGGFADLKDKITQVRGLASPKDGAGGDHASGCQSWFRAGGNGTSVDQIAHKAHMASADKTRFGSLAVNVNGGCVAQDGGGPQQLCAISWIDSATYTTRDSNPQAYFDKLFAGFKPVENNQAALARRAMDESVLSSVKDEAARLDKKLGAADRQVLNRYLTSIQELEARVNALPVEPGTGSCSPGTAPVGSEGRPAIAKALIDLTILAFECDLARYGAFMLENGGDYTTYTHLGATVNHHANSHDGPFGPNDSLAKTEKWMLDQMAYFARGLKNATDPSGSSLLDSFALILGNEVSSGSGHTHTNMPTLIAGGLNGYFKMGQTIQTTGNCGDLWVELLTAVGAPQAKVGNSTGRRLTEILA